MGYETCEGAKDLRRGYQCGAADAFLWRYVEPFNLLLTVFSDIYSGLSRCSRRKQLVDQGTASR
jgi:hypothetical protein